MAYDWENLTVGKKTLGHTKQPFTNTSVVLQLNKSTQKTKLPFPCLQPYYIFLKKFLTEFTFSQKL